MSEINPKTTDEEVRQAKLAEADRLDWVAKNTSDDKLKAHFERAANEIRKSLK